MGLLDSLKKIANLAAPIAGTGIANLLVTSGSKLFSGLGNFVPPVGEAIGETPEAITITEQNELIKKIREMNPNLDDEQLQELVLRQTAKAPTSYQDFSGLVPLNVASGGGIRDLRQAGGMSLGPGTEKSDSIPAMLSDGEFVMTSKAVRGIGNGSRKLGAKRMYDMMHRAERNATV